MNICVDLGQSGDRMVGPLLDHSLGQSHPDRESGLSMWPATLLSPASHSLAVTPWWWQRRSSLEPVACSKANFEAEKPSVSTEGSEG